MSCNVSLLRAVLTALSLSFACPAVQADTPLSVYFKAETFTYSETVPIEAALHEWDTTDYEAGEQQWGWNWLEIGVRWKWFALGYLWREDYDLRFSEDAAELYWLTSNQASLPDDKRYNLDLRARHFQADGVRVAFRNHHSIAALQLDYQVGYSRFRAQDLIDGRLTGSAQTLDDSDYEYQADLNYHYSEDRLFEREVGELTGVGQAVDLALQVHFQQHRVKLSITDLYGIIDWEQAPYTEGTVDSDNKRYDSSGYVRVNPTLSGYEGVTATYRQRLDARYESEYEYLFSNRLAAGMMLRRQYDKTFVGASVALLQNQKLKLGYWPEIEMIQVQWRAQRWTVSVGADGVGDGVRALSLLVAYQPETSLAQ